MRLVKKRDHSFVYALLRVRLNQFAKHCSAGGKFMLQAQHGERNRACLGAGKTDHANPAAAGRRSNGDNRIVKIHLFMRQVVAFQPGKVVFNPFINMVDLAMQMRHFQFSFQIHFIIQV